MRCSGEIDICTPRWDEQPTQVAVLILNNVKFSASGLQRRNFLLARKQAISSSKKLLKRIRATRFGWIKFHIIKRLIFVYRSTI